MEKIKDYLLSNVWMVALLAIVLSLWWPAVGVWMAPYASFLLMSLVFLSFTDVNSKRIKLHLKNYPRKILLFFIFHLLMPVLVWLFRSYLPDEIFLGLMLVAVMPVGLNIANLVGSCGGSEPKAKVISLITNFLSPVTTVLLFYLFVSGYMQVDIRLMALGLLKLVIVPLVLASIIRKTNLKEWTSIYGRSISLGVSFCLVLALIAPVRDNIVYNWDKTLFLGFLVGLFVVVNLLVGYFVGSDEKERITFALVNGNKNSPLAAVLAISLFGNLVAIPAVIYLIVSSVLMLPLEFVCQSKWGQGNKKIK